VELECQRRIELERHRHERLYRIREETGKLNIEISRAQKQIDHIYNRLSDAIKNINNADEMALLCKSSMK